jgi:hypothetical protein
MKKLLLLLLCVPLIFSCGGDDTNNLQREITQEMMEDGYTGKGTYTLPEGPKYVGEWKNGVYHGFGTFFYEDGAKFIGKYKYGLMYGQAEYINADGEVFNYENGEFIGE